MTVITTEHIAIAELVVYIPTAIITAFVVFKHGFHKQLGWIYLCIFSGFRIGGAVMEILSTNDSSNTNDKEWATILQSVGLSPLLLSTIGLLKTIFDNISQHVPSAKDSKRNVALRTLGASSGIAGKILQIVSKRATATSRRSRMVQLLHIPAIIALFLAISGGTSEASSDIAEHVGGQTKTRVAIILFLSIYVAAYTLWAITVSEIHIMLLAHKRIFLGVFFSLNLIACRLLYSLISAFGNNPKFSLINGDVTIQLVMATIEEFLVVLIYMILGVITPPPSLRPARVFDGHRRGPYNGEAYSSITSPESPDHQVPSSSRSPRYAHMAYTESTAQEAYYHHVRQ